MTIIYGMIIDDYRMALRSRYASVAGRREVLNGRAKFGIFGDGKEVVQLAMAHPFEKGDWRSGYYRDQTLLFALGLLKENIHAALAGFQRTSCPGDDRDRGFDLYTVRGWDYPALCETFLMAARETRQNHVPALVHVTELTQPLGHSTSGSHERYKTDDRLAWEAEYDCIAQFHRYLIEQSLAEAALLDQLKRAEALEGNSAAGGPSPGSSDGVPAIKPVSSPSRSDEAPVPKPVSSKAPFLSPLSRKLIRTHSLDPAKIRGTGLGGRVMKQDILDYLERNRKPSLVPHSTMRRKIAERILRSIHTTAPVLMVMELNSSRLFYSILILF